MKHMIAYPEMGGAEIAAMFHYTPAYISQLIHSDLFQMELRYWQDLGVSEATLSVKDRLNDVAHQSLERLQARLATVGDQISVDRLVDISEMALKNLGFGAPKTHAMTAGPQVFNNNVQVNNFGNEPVDAQLLAEARQRMLLTPPLIRNSDVQRDGNSNDDPRLEAGESAQAPDESPTGSGLGEPLEGSVASVSLEPPRGNS